MRALRQLTIDELKTIQLDILGVTTKFCEEHGINYWLNAGTLIGAVRHKGYIPWDDDIDLGMLRADYDKFTAAFNKHNERYKVVCFENDNTFPFPFAKVMDTHTVLYEPDEKGRKLCINIDIFVYDNSPEDKAAENRMFMRRNCFYICNVARQARILQRPKGNILRRMCVYALRSAVRLFPRNFFVRKTIENSKRYLNAETKCIGDFVGTRRMTCDKKVFDSFIDGEFEGRTYKIPVGYDEYLRELYGDYMQLPTPDERVSTHIFKAYAE